MNFDLSKEQEMIRHMIHEFAEEQVAPEADERDRSGNFRRRFFNS